jgi:hypothetical protein
LNLSINCYIFILLNPQIFNQIAYSLSLNLQESLFTLNLNDFNILVGDNQTNKIFFLPFIKADLDDYITILHLNILESFPLKIFSSDSVSIFFDNEKSG